MISNVEAFYQRIANAIIENLPNEWRSAAVTVIFYSDSITWEPEFRTITGELRSFDISMQLTRAFRELRRKFKEVGQPVWGQASFELKPDGKFNMKWGYDNCDENGDTIWNDQEWHRRQKECEKRLSQS